MKDEMRRGWAISSRPGERIQEDDDIDLLELARTIWRGKLWILLATLLAIFIGGYYAYRIAVPMFTAKSVVALENRQSQFVDLQNVMSGLSGDQATINTEIEVLRSRGLVEQLVGRMNLTEDPEFNAQLRVPSAFSRRSIMQAIGLVDAPATPSAQQVLNATIDRVLEAVSISNVRSSYVFVITVITSDPLKSAEIANTLAELYILDQIEFKFQATEQATVWLSDRVSTLKSELETADARVKSFAAETRLVSADALDALNRQVKDTRDRLASLETSTSLLDARLTAFGLARDSGDIDEMVRLADDVTLTRLANTGATEDTILARLELLRVRTEEDLARANAQRASLAASVAQLEADYDQQSKDLVTLQQLQREAEANRLLYEYFLSRMKETAAQEGIQQPDSRVISKAAEPGTASAPRKSRILALSGLIGLLIGTAAVLFREMAQNGFRTAEDVEAATGHTVLGQIPRIPKRDRGEAIDYLIDNPTSAAAEAVRNLRTSLVLSNIDKPPQVFLATSCVPGEGKTTTSFALAQNFSGMGKRVLLVEGDIRRRVFSEHYGLRNADGLIAVLSGKRDLQECVQRLGRVGIDVLIGEDTSVNAADVFSSNRFQEFIDDARAIYDVIIIDTPPVLVVPDARIIAQAVDAILFTVKWDDTPRHQVNEAIRLFETAGRAVTGIVLTQIDAKGMKRYGYGDRYGAYSTYGSKYYTD
ncbi:polysaccharide biosynthesis tyrosine autokinase [Sinisalibacter aestuarii]|uniref:non-specific protein-tyrosine kinase n=1 Tax=Sinisalibacter aestuarii TaxID=2949426 RepID=A0ABQ5LW95_9RHOB|nr:polysaccharide biosynthesis tyrosine autokinase [Sinisalibacter aestuarii]GKY89243.1 hypothetical protein STA1M1_31120 [Sinisalibacter aestuarii]